MNRVILSFWTLLLPLWMWGSTTYDVAIALMFQNEARFLKEWIEYHRMMGVDHFYLFNNLSTDNYLEVIEPYIAEGIAELYEYPFPSENQKDYLHIQCAIYNHALDLSRGHVKWLALIDADEYIVPLENASLPELLEEFESYGGVYLNWVNFGTSHVEKIPEDHLRVERLLHCQGVSLLGKSIVRPERVAICQDPHALTYFAPYFHVNTSGRRFRELCPFSERKMQLFHYYTGDVDHLVNVKFPRRRKWIPGLELNEYLQSMEAMNATYLPEMLKFAPALRQKMGFDRKP